MRRRVITGKRADSERAMYLVYLQPHQIVTLVLGIEQLCNLALQGGVLTLHAYLRYEHKYKFCLFNLLLKGGLHLLGNW